MKRATGERIFVGNVRHSGTKTYTEMAARQMSGRKATIRPQ